MVYNDISKMTGIFNKLNNEESFTNSNEDNWAATAKGRTNTHEDWSVAEVFVYVIFVVVRLIGTTMVLEEDNIGGVIVKKASWWGFHADTITMELIPIVLAIFLLFAGAIYMTIPNENKEIKNYEDLSGADANDADKEEIKEDYEDQSYATQTILIFSAAIFLAPYIYYGGQRAWNWNERRKEDAIYESRARERAAASATVAQNAQPVAPGALPVAQPVAQIKPNSPPEKQKIQFTIPKGHDSDTINVCLEKMSGGVCPGTPLLVNLGTNWRSRVGEPLVAEMD